MSADGIAKSALRPIAAIQVVGELAPNKELGVVGEFGWLFLDQLYIDPNYQRGIVKYGTKNIVSIVNDFRWEVFSPLVVSERGIGKYAVIDGQHRAIAALMHGGIDKLPCYIINASPEMEGKAFSVINGKVTQVTGLQLHAARIIANDPLAMQVEKVATAAGAKVLRSSVPADKMKPGETIAVVILYDAIAMYGEEIVEVALKTITKTGINIGMVKASIIKSTCYVLKGAPCWLHSSKLLPVIAKATVAVLYREAEKAKVLQGGSFMQHYGMQLQILLRKEIGPPTLRK